MYYKELALTVIEKEKSQDLQFAIWRPRRAVVLSSSPTPSLKSENQAQRSLHRESDLSLSQPLCSMQAISGLHKVQLHWEGSLLYSVYWSRCQSHPETFLHTDPEYVWPNNQAPQGLVKLTRRIIHHGMGWGIREGEEPRLNHSPATFRVHVTLCLSFSSVKWSS